MNLLKEYVDLLKRKDTESQDYAALKQAFDTARHVSLLLRDGDNDNAKAELAKLVKFLNARLTK